MTANGRAFDDGMEARDERRVLWPMIALFWVVNVGLTTVQVYVNVRPHGVFPNLLDVLRFMLWGYLVWFASVPLIVQVLTRRFRFERGRWPVALAVHLMASVIIAAATQVVDTLVMQHAVPTRPFLQTFLSLAATWMLWAVFTYWFFVVLVLAVRHHTTAAAREHRATQLAAAAASAQLTVLRTQLHPHFLFNALNSISSLIFDQPREAQKMLAQLGELLRATLAEGTRGSWTLRRELDLLERYTAIERVRFGERLRVEVDCEPAALDALVPTLLLQPLVENAILHGIQPSMYGGTVRIGARRTAEVLQLEVDDDGMGLPTENGNGRRERVGLSNCRERLEMQFGGEQSLRIAPREPSGTRVSIRIPWSTEETRDDAPR
jgi:two-component system LytT family sensor kinase